ncbi:AraC family transcriptional regulator [Algiphilus sp. W345]|uniref:AraC family transcriptional regulator n=1 Tax=Banduia mediterranea TaxID=3075609 RepID=A0ABU2WIT4_9GAMM|nr:AraC family transcriptional regulator [Algiphilus sp. W345]MDT0497752.1 AraC family transcriptional regulator [Algiphilus sp. W345]
MNDLAPHYRAQVSPLYARSLLDYLREHEFDPAKLFDARQLAAVEDTDARARMPLADWVRMFERAIAVTGDPDLALRVGAAIKPRHYGLLGYVAMSCATLSEAIDRLEHYEKIVGEVSETRLVLRGESAELHWRAPFDAHPPPVLAQSSLAGWVNYARWLLGREHLSCEVLFADPPPPNPQGHREILRCEPVFGAAFTGLRFPADWLQLPIVQADAELNALMDAQARALLSEIAHEPEPLPALRHVISRGLAAGRTTLRDNARPLGLSPRTLQRRLDELGIRYQSVLDDVRRRHAERYLTDPKKSLAEIAYLLGYSEQSAFTRAYRRWTGMAPSRAR